MKFDFTEQEAQIILNCLQEQPYKIVVSVINKLQAQAVEQMRTDKKSFGVNIPGSENAV